MVTFASAHNGGKSQVNLNALQTGGDFPFINQMLNAGFMALGDNSGAPAPTDLDSNGYPIPGSDAMVNHSGVVAVGYLTAAYNQPPIMVAQITGKGFLFSLGTVITTATQTTPITITSITGASSTATINFSGAHLFTVGMEVPLSGITGTIAASLNGSKFVISAVGSSTSITITVAGTTGLSGSGGIAAYGDLNCGVATGGRVIVNSSNVPVNDGYQVSYWILTTDATFPITKVAVMYLTEEARYNAGEIFSAKFLAKLQEGNFGVVRFLNSMNTNISNIVNWADRCPINYFCYGGTRKKSSTYAGTLAGLGNAYTGSIGLGALQQGAQATCRFPAQNVTGVTIGAAGVITTSAAHGLVVGDVFNVYGNFGGTTNVAGITYVPGGIPSYDSGNTYGGGTVNLYVLTTPTSSSLTFSTSPGGAAFTTTGTTGTFKLHKTVTDNLVTYSGTTITTTNPHALAVGDIVGFESRGGSILPTNINGQGGYYFVKTIPTSTTITISATSGGVAITFTGSPSGTNSMCQLPTVNMDGLGAKPIMSQSGSVLSKGGNAIPRSLTFSYSAPLASITYDSVLDAWLLFGSQDGWSDMGVEANAWPPEIAFTLCAQIGAHPWFPSPPYVLDPITDYMPSLAKYVVTNKPSWMRPIYEINNEQWNGQFFGSTLSLNHGYKYAANGNWTTNFAAADQIAGKMASALGQALSVVHGGSFNGYDVGLGVQTGIMTGPSISDHDPRLTASEYTTQTNAVQAPLSGTWGTITFVKQSAALWTNFICPATYTTPSVINTGTESTLATTFNGKSVVGSVSGTALTVSSQTYNTLAIGDTLFGNGIPNWNTPVTIISGSHPNWTLSSDLGTLASRTIYAASNIQAAKDYIDALGGAAGAFNIAQITTLYTDLRAWSQQSKFNDSIGGSKKTYAYEGGYSPDFTGNGQFTYSLVNMLRFGSKFVTSSNLWIDGLQGALTAVYNAFTGQGGKYPSCFQFTGSSTISGIWCVLEDIYQTPNPPQWNSIVAYNQAAVFYFNNLRFKLHPVILLSTPTLIWATAANINSPQFTIDIDDTVVVGDVITLQVQTIGGNWSSPVSSTSHIITSGEDAAFIVNMNLAALPNATYEARCRVTHSGIVSQWSAIVSQTILLLAVPASTLPPVISGNVTSPGNVLTTTNGTWTGTAPITYSYQWQRGGVNIGGATSSTYALVSGDVGALIRCNVTATNSQGATSQITNTLVIGQVPANSVAPVISGTPNIGQVLTASNGTWNGSPSAFTYQWKSNGTNISGATANTYTVLAGDLGNAITCAVTGSNGWGSSTATSNSLTIVVTTVFTYAASATGNGGTTSRTFPINIGTASADRLVVVALFVQNWVSPTVVVNGVTLTQDVAVSGGNGTAVYSGLVTTGSGTQNVVVNGVQVFVEVAVSVWTGTGMVSNTVKHTGSNAVGGTNSPISINVTAGDFIVAIAQSGSGAAPTWASSTQTPTSTHTADPTIAFSAEWLPVTVTNAAFSVAPSSGSVPIAAAATYR